MKKMVGLVVMLGVGILVLAGCGQSTASEKKLSKSDNVFESGKTFKIRDSDEQSYYFEVESKSDGNLSVYDLENNRKEYQFPYKIEKQENGNILYKFDGPKINDYPLFYNGAYGKTDNYYIINKNKNYYFVSERFYNKEGDFNRIIENYTIPAMEIKN